MSTKHSRIIYWSITGLLCLFFLPDGISGIAQVPAGQDSMRQLGYPLYLLTIIGVAKVLAVLALLQPRYPRLKEWAYAGLVINVIGAALSWGFVGGPVFNVVLPLIFLALILTSYFLWKKGQP